MTLAALFCGLMVLGAFISLVSAPEYDYQQPWADYAQARTTRLVRALLLYGLGMIGLFGLALHACL